MLIVHLINDNVMPQLNRISERTSRQAYTLPQKARTEAADVDRDSISSASAARNMRHRLSTTQTLYLLGLFSLLLLVSMPRAADASVTCNNYFLVTADTVVGAPEPSVAITSYPSPARTGSMTITVRSELVSSDLSPPPNTVRRAVSMYLDSGNTLNSTQKSDLNSACKAVYSTFVITDWNGPDGAAEGGIPTGVSVDGDNTAATYCSNGWTLTGTWPTLVSSCNWDTSASNVSHWVYRTNVFIDYADSYLDALLVQVFVSNSMTASIEYAFAKDSSDAFVPNTFKVTNFGYSRPTKSTTKLLIAYEIQTYYPYKPALHANGLTVPSGWSSLAKGETPDSSSGLETQSCDSVNNPVNGVTTCTQTGELSYTFNTTDQCDPAGTFTVDLDVGCYGGYTCNPGMGRLAQSATQLSVGPGLNLCASIYVVNPITVLEPFAALSPSRKQGEPVVHKMKFNSTNQKMQLVKLQDYLVGQLPAGNTPNGYSYEWYLYQGGSPTTMTTNTAFNFAADLSSSNFVCSLSATYYPSLGPNKTDYMMSMSDLGKTLTWSHTIKFRMYYDTVMTDRRRLMYRDGELSGIYLGELEYEASTQSFQAKASTSKPEVDVADGQVVPSTYVGLSSDATYSSQYNLKIPSDLPLYLFNGTSGENAVAVSTDEGTGTPVVVPASSSRNTGMGPGAIAGFVLAGFIAAGLAGYFGYRHWRKVHAKVEPGKATTTSNDGDRSESPSRAASGSIASGSDVTLAEDGALPSVPEKKPRKKNIWVMEDILDQYLEPEDELGEGGSMLPTRETSGTIASIVPSRETSGTIASVADFTFNESEGNPEKKKHKKPRDIPPEYEDIVDGVERKKKTRRGSKSDGSEVRAPNRRGSQLQYQ